MTTFNITVSKTIKLTQENIDDIVCTALEGGINYWCKVAEPIGEYLGKYASEQISRGGKLKLYDAEENSQYELRLDNFLKGFKLWVENGYDEYDAVQSDGTVDCCEIDTACADEIIQLALFDEIVFG